MAELEHFGVVRSLDDVQRTAVTLKKGALASEVVNEEQELRAVQKKVLENKMGANVQADVVNQGLVWTPQQMKMLQEALASVPKDTKDRWEVIATKVVGKTAVECQDRYHELIELAKKADEWSAEQQKQLEHGLKTIPASDPARWDKIAEGVTGKDRKACVARFKWLVEKMKNKK